MVTRIYLSVIFVVALFTHTYSQPLNQSQIMTKCDEYQLNINKVKLKLDPKIAVYNLTEIKVGSLDSVLLVPVVDCGKYLQVVSGGSQRVEDVLAKKIKDIYPSSKSDINLKIHLKEIRIMNNRLPTTNSRMYVSMDFFLQRKGGDYKLVYSSTEHSPFIQHVEQLLGRLIRNSIHDFYDNKRYVNVFKNYSYSDRIGEEKNLKGIYTSFGDLFENRPSYDLTFKVKINTGKGMISKYYLISDENIKISQPVLAFNGGKKTYLNVSYYYTKDHFVELTDLNEEFYMIYDRVDDYGQASDNTVLSGEAIELIVRVIIKALVNLSTASKKNLALINKKTGRMTVLENKRMKEILTDFSKAYKSYKKIIKSENRDELVVFLRKMLSEEKVRARLPKYM